MGNTGATGTTGADGSQVISVPATADTNGRTVVGIAGGTFTAANAYCASPTAPGAGKSWTFAISVGGSAKGTCTISGTATSGSIGLTSFGVTPGTVVTVVTANVGASSNALWALIITP